jgi:hypothetical protein
MILFFVYAILSFYAAIICITLGMAALSIIAAIIMSPFLFAIGMIREFLGYDE